MSAIKEPGDNVKYAHKYDFETLDPHRQEDGGNGYYDTKRWPAKSDFYRMPWSKKITP